jgi:hypothetical protein
MKQYLKTFEQFINEADQPIKAPDSKVYIDDVILSNGKTIKAAEILGAIKSSETEDKFRSYFHEAYGETAFAPEDMSNLVTYFNKYKEEENQEETDKEQKEKESGSEETGDKESTDKEGSDVKDELAGL